VHLLTGFNEYTTTQKLPAQIGIRFHMSVIPAVIILICTIIYWKYYPITPQVWMENKQKLKELGF
jgi:Na+/melibiose symporter-like transporter